MCPAFIAVPLHDPSYLLFCISFAFRQWEDQCECLSTACCGAWRSKSDHGVASKRLGALFALMFSHIDLTPSDILVSFGLALNRQRFLRRVAYRQRNKTPSSKQPRRRPAASSVALGGMQQLSMSPERQPERTSPASSDGLLQDIEMGPDPGSSGSAALGGAHSSNDAATAPQGPETNAQDQSPEIEPVDAESLAEAAYFMKYAFAAYGWMLFVWQRRTTGCLQLCCGRTCGLWASLATRRRGAPANVLKAPYLNTEAILQAAELPEQDLVFVRLEGEGTNVLPYFVALDHAKQAVVIAIRGELISYMKMRPWPHPEAGPQARTLGQVNLGFNAAAAVFLPRAHCG